MFKAAVGSVAYGELDYSTLPLYNHEEVISRLPDG